jgi:hypothetical protein
LILGTYFIKWASMPVVIVITFLTIYLSQSTCFASKQKANTNGIVFLMVYETDKPLNLKKAVAYFSRNKWFTQKKDSVVIDFTGTQGSPDSIIYNNIWGNSVYLTLKLIFKEQTLMSNTFYVLPNKLTYNAIVRDNQLKIRAKLAESFSSGQSSIQGIALIFQTILEMMIALIISKIFRLPRQVILMVLAANIAAFPLNLLHFPTLFLREVAIFIVKAIVMIIIGLRKMPKYQILLLLLAITFIGLGFKELFLLLTRFF